MHIPSMHEVVAADNLFRVDDKPFLGELFPAITVKHPCSFYECAQSKERAMGVASTGKSSIAIPQIDHDHSEQEIYTDILAHHVSVFEHQEHEHQSTEPALCLPENKQNFFTFYKVKYNMPVFIKMLKNIRMIMIINDKQHQIIPGNREQGLQEAQQHTQLPHKGETSALHTCAH